MSEAFSIPLFTPCAVPPLSHVSKYAGNESIHFDTGLYFVKQTLRNRYHILSPNGVQTLIIPVRHNNGKSQPLHEVLISYADNWPMNHWRSLEAAYRRSPFFEYYEHDLLPIYDKRYEYLIDFSKAVQDFLSQALQLHTKIIYLPATPGPEKQGPHDFRFLSETGLPVTETSDRHYLQVFNRTGQFISGLSAFDALFNLGPVTAESAF